MLRVKLCCEIIPRIPRQGGAGINLLGDVHNRSVKISVELER
jgi:hypothetical protein